MSALTNIFLKYPNPVYIETGAYSGDSIQFAVDANFETIYSIELDPHWYYHCWGRFLNYPNVHLVYGNSYFMLDWLLRKINRPITFWLDAHSPDGASDIINHATFPLMQELEAIKKHHIKNHTIIIDDLRCWSIKKYGWDTKVLQNKILEINAQYEFIFEDGTIPKDILIAKKGNEK